MEEVFKQKQTVDQTEKIHKDEPASAGEQFMSIYEQMLETESFEESSEFLKDINETQKWRENHKNSKFGSFYDFFEDISRANKTSFSAEKKKEVIEEIVSAAARRVNRLSPRVSDFYSAILTEIAGEKYESHFEKIAVEMEKLRREGIFNYLTGDDIKWEDKLKCMQSRLEGILIGARVLDKKEGKEMDDDIRKWREEELKKAPRNPPGRRNESKPGVDPMERLKQGEKARATWSIHPAWGGYYKEQSFSKWDSQRNVWFEDEYIYSDARSVSLSGNIDPNKGPIGINLQANVNTNEWISLPVPYTHDFHRIESMGKNCLVKEDQNGDLVIFVEGSGEEAEINVFLAPVADKKFVSKEPEKIKVPDMPSEFSEETKSKLAEIAGKKRGNIARAWVAQSYAISRISYLAPKDRAEADYYNSIYRTSPKGFAGAVDEVKTGDCDTVNTYFAALCAKIDVPVRHCTGHSVKGKDERGASSINSGTGHGWSEVWDEIKKEWIRFDATPSGDPNLEEQEKSEDDAAPGDYGERQAARPSDEQLEELRKKLAEHTEKLSYTKEERQLAESEGIELKEARQIVKEINEAEKTRLKNGELVVDVMANLFNLIAESRKKELPAYSGPARRREGGEAISHIIQHYIGVMAGESDPASREKPEVEIKEEKLLNGMDVYVICDKSGSMQDITEEKNEKLCQMQRRFAYLLFSSLYRVNTDLEKAHLLSDKALDVRAMGISFRGDNIDDIDLDKPLSSRFIAKDKVKMWRSLSKAGGDNGDITAIQYVYQKIKEEKEKMAREGISDNRLRIIIAYSDGGYVGAEAQMKAWAEELSNLKTVVVGIGLTESAATVPIVMHNPPKSFGEIVSNMDQLIAATAKHIVLQAIKLFPEKARENAEHLIEETLYKFGVK